MFTKTHIVSKCGKNTSKCLFVYNHWSLKGKSFQKGCTHPSKAQWSHSFHKKFINKRPRHKKVRTKFLHCQYCQTYTSVHARVRSTPEFPRCRARRFPERSRRTDGSATLAGSPPAPRCAFAQPYLNGESMLCYLFRSVITMFRRDLGIGRCNVWVGV